jgi:translocation and assembly module TamA
LKSGPTPQKTGAAGPEIGLKITLTFPASASQPVRLRRLIRLRAVALAGLLLAAAAAPPATLADEQAPWPPEKPSAPEPGDTAEPGIAYNVEINGLAEGERDLETLLRDSSRLIGLQADLPATVAGVRRRARADVERFQQALRSEGFYDAEVSFEIVVPAPTDPADDSTARAPEADTGDAPDVSADATTAPKPAEAVREPLKVRFDVDTGTVYLLARVEISYNPAIPRERAGIPRGAEDLDLSLGMRARAPTIQAAERRLLATLENHGYPQAAVAERQAVIDRSQTTMRLDWQIDPGPFTRFGPLEMRGLDTVEAKYVRSFRTWQPGDVYDQRKIEEMRGALLETGLFDSIQVALGDETADAQTPIALTFEERDHRSIGFGARYSTSVGPSGTAFWEHRNLLGQDENLRLELDAGLIEQSFTASARKPRWNRDDQDLLGNVELRHKDTEGFEEYAAETAVSLEREFDDLWTGRLGGSVEALQTTDNEGTREFILFGVPTALTRDSRDDPLDPTEGSRLSLEATPYLATLEATQPFARASLGGATYYAFDDDDRFVLAGRARLGTLFGAETEQVPASKRFYAGGGGSIRGFPFEEVGPLDDENDPLGGRSLVELGLELRIKVTDSIGIVPFVDAGQVYDTVYPDFSVDEPLRFGAGLGLRYYTAIGPVRLDVAVPLNPRETNDNAFEIYISLGQAF